MKREYIVPTQEIASGIALSKDSKKENQEIENGYSNLKTSKFSKLKFVLGSTYTLTFLLLLAFDVFILNGIKSEMAKSNYID